MRFFIKFILLSILAAFLCFFVFIYIKGGDLLLNYLAESLHFQISYKNRCSFVEAFICRTVYLDSPVLISMDFPSRIECESALIEIDYSRVLTEGGIGLHCRLKGPVFCGDTSLLTGDQTVLDMFPADIFSAVSAPTNLEYADIFCDLYMYGTTVEFPNFLAKSSQIILKANGMADDDGSFDLNLKIFFSPKMVAEFGEHANIILEQASDGWMSFALNIGVDKDGQAFKVESSIFRLNITEYEKK